MLSRPPAYRPDSGGGGLTPTTRALILLALALAPYTLARLILLGAFWEDFRELTPGQLFLGLANGLRFDLATVLPLLVIPFGCLHLPIRGAVRPAWIKGWGWAGFALVAATLPLLFGSLYYYDEVRRHLERELLLLTADFGFLREMVFVHHRGAALALLAGIAILGGVWRRALAAPARQSRHPWPMLALAVGLSLLGIRGSLDRKPLNPTEAYRHQSFALGNLSLNGVYTSAAAALDGGRPARNPLALPEALAALELDPTARYPLLQSGPEPPAGPRRNLVLILLESWDVGYIGAYGDPRGLTPHFDRLAEQSRVYEEFFAASQRTIGAVQAVMTGIPALPGIPELGRGLEHTHTTRLGKSAKARGYRTLFIQSSHKTSYYLDAIMSALGFDAVYGKGEIPLRGDYPHPDAKWGWDHDMLQFALDRLEETLEPFLAVILTGTTHSPYADPGPPFRVAAHDPHGLGGYLNTLVYADWAIGQFFERARKSAWYARTVFLIGADHVKRAGSTDLRQAFRIPFLIHGPQIPPGRVRGIHSQLDVLPTLMALAGLPGPYAALGKSLLEPSAGMAVVQQGERLGIIGDGGEITHTVEKRLEAKSTGAGAPPGYLERLEHRLLAVHKVTTELVRSNRWAPPGPP